MTFDWETDAAGNLVLYQLEGFETATLSADRSVLRVEWLLNVGEPTEGLVGVQLVLTRDQAREVGHALLRLADAPHIPTPPTPAQHWGQAMLQYSSAVAAFVAAFLWFWSAWIPLPATIRHVDGGFIGDSQPKPEDDLDRLTAGLRKQSRLSAAGAIAAGIAALLQGFSIALG
jgi:hypothetical protein